MQFQGQTHILTVPVDTPDVTREELHNIFAKAYWKRFAVELEEIRPVVVNLHTAVIGKRKSIDLLGLIDDKARKKNINAAKVGMRSVWFEGGRAETPIYQREALPLNAKLKGPAILEQSDTTLVVEPKDSLAIDGFGNIIMSVG